MFTRFVLYSLLIFIPTVSGICGEKKRTQRTAETLHQLIPASATMTTAWDVPMNPLTDTSLHSSPLTEQIRWGFKLFTNTLREAARFAPNALSCNNCHLNAGQKLKAMPLVGIAAIYPEYNKREGRLFSLEDRIVGCFRRSMGAIGPRIAENEALDVPLPTLESK